MLTLLSATRISVSIGRNKPMRYRRQMRKEHKAACEALDALMQEGIEVGCNGPLPEKVGLYLRLNAIKSTVERCDPALVKTETRGTHPAARSKRFEELMGYRHITLGPAFAELHP